MDSLKHLLYDYLVSVGLTDNWAKYLNMIALVIGLRILVFIFDFIFSKILIGVFFYFVIIFPSK